ncbi:MAG: transcription antitermination factor NusB [Coriobacteriia bacterium]|nr:transcription antitermination factor NusB [Coriobacteriia bacterium]
MTASMARRAALDVVARVRERTGYAHEVLDARLRSSKLSSSDAGLATRLAYGTLQTEGTLDEVLDRYLEGKKLEPRVRDALRLSAYEILFMHTPSRAAVHQGVELVRGLRPQAAGMANAVLRRASEDAETFPWGDPETDTAALARLYGHPLWLTEMWVDELGREHAAEMLAANNEPAPLYVAINPFAPDRGAVSGALQKDGTAVVSCPVPGCFELAEGAAAVNGSAIRDGIALVTDASAQFVAGLVPALPGSSIVEIGSGRGTKTMLIQGRAISAGGPAEIYAVDLHEFKAHLLEQRLERFGVPGVHALIGDARDIAAIPGIPAPAGVDVAFIDAPCSGLGTLRRHPEKRWRVAAADIEALGSLGGELLAQAASLVRSGGVVVYSTCTVARRENAEVVESFLATELGGEFRLEMLGDGVPEVWRQFITAEGYFSSFPVSGAPDGHFAARLVRDASAR